MLSLVDSTAAPSFALFPVIFKATPTPSINLDAPPIASIKKAINFQRHFIVQSSLASKVTTMTLSLRSVAVSKRLFLRTTTTASPAAASRAPAIQFETIRNYGVSSPAALPMKPGTVLKYLGILKGQDPPAVLPRKEYPAWVSELATPQPSLAVLRRMPNEEAEDSDIRRYLKLSRRQHIRQKNEQASV